MILLEALDISGFRKYKEFSLKNLGMVNCIAGANNVGKTSLLEAVYTWSCGQSVIPVLVAPLARERYPGLQNPFWLMDELLTVFYNRHTIPLMMSFCGTYNGRKVSFEHKVFPSDILTDYDSSYSTFSDEIISSANSQLPENIQRLLPTEVISGGIRAFAKWRINSNENGEMIYDITVPILQGSYTKPFCLAKFIDVTSHISIAENVKIYSLLKREKQLTSFVEELRKVFPEIAGIDMLPYPDASQSPISVEKTDGKILPLYAYGDGVQKWFYILGAMFLYKGSIICIDEIDTGFHPAAQVIFCKNMIESAMKNNVQVFITTHNLEFIDNFLKAASEINDAISESIRIITLREKNMKVSARTLNASEAAEAREEFALELR